MPFPEGYKPPGRKASGSTLKGQEMRRRLVEKLEKEFDPVVDSQIDLAKGITVVVAREKELKDGVLKRTGKWYVVSNSEELLELLNGSGVGEDYYKIVTKEPSEKAAAYLLDQAMGKSTQTIETPGLNETLADLVVRLNLESKT